MSGAFAKQKISRNQLKVKQAQSVSQVDITCDNGVWKVGNKIYLSPTEAAIAANKLDGGILGPVARKHLGRTFVPA